MALVSSSVLRPNRSFPVSTPEWPGLRSEITRIYDSSIGPGRHLTSCTYEDDSLLATVATPLDSKLTTSQSAVHHLNTLVRVPNSSVEANYYSDSQSDKNENVLRPLGKDDERNMVSENSPELSDVGISLPDESKDIQHKGSQSKNPQERKKCKRKIPKKKLRTRSDKKWKTLAIDELGFYTSLLPNLLPVNFYSDDRESSADTDCEVHLQDLEVSTSDCCSVESTNTNAHKNSDINAKKCVPQISPGNNVKNTETNDSEDDITFFGKLGIDILNDDYESDPIMDWDGVIFRRPKPEHRESLSITRQSDMTVFSNKCKRESIQSTKNYQVEDIFYHPSGASFSVIKKCESYKLYELECSSSSKVYVRADRSRRVEKAHKAVKSKNCNSVFNNKGHKSLYMHHRLIKINNISLDFRKNARHSPVPAMTKLTLDLSVAKAVIKANKNILLQNQMAPVQNVKHALRETNAPRHLETDLASFLITLQHRELTPEDYDMLLRLDESVKPKTVSKNILDSMRTETVGPNGIDTGPDDMPPVCTVCMEPYVAGQERKFLPCNHNFHTKCIDVWLKNASMNCPLDGLPVGLT